MTHPTFQERDAREGALIGWEVCGAVTSVGFLVDARVTKAHVLIDNGHRYFVRVFSAGCGEVTNWVPPVPRSGEPLERVVLLSLGKEAD